MGLFQKRSEIGNNMPIYSLGLQKVYLIVGLGNPGEQYAKTRHNIGFSVVDYIASKNNFPNWVKKSSLSCQLSSGKIGDSQVFLIKPMTFMNESGLSVSKVQNYYKLSNSLTAVIYDELSIDFGTIRTRVGGESAGHNGIKSLIDHIGEDFGRIRIGINSSVAQKEDSASFVLKPFSKKEQGSLELLNMEVNSIISEYIFSGQLPHDTRKVLL